MKKPTLPRKPKGRARPEKPPILSKREDQYIEHSIAPCYEPMIGRVTVAWSRLDGAIQEALWRFLKISMSDGRIITSKLDTGVTAQMLRAMGARHLVTERLQEFLDRLNQIEDCRDQRNAIAHGTWVTMQPENVPMVMSLRTKSDDGQVVAESFPADRLNTLEKTITEIREWLIALMHEIGASPDKLLRQHTHD
jgi:hypothetical protein